MQKVVPIIQSLWKQNKTPIIVGGTYLYIKHLLYGQDIAVPANQKLRNELEKLSVLDLQNRLLHYYIKMKLKPDLNKSDWNNPRRLIRKIEIFQSDRSNSLTREPVNSLMQNLDNIKIIGLRHITPEAARKAITKRVEKRLEQGAIEEVKKILKMGYKPTDPGLQTIGYKQIIQFLNGELTEKEAIDQWITKEVQYAKRQLTFIKKDENITWVDV